MNIGVSLLNDKDTRMEEKARADLRVITGSKALDLGGKAWER